MMRTRIVTMVVVITIISTVVVEAQSTRDPIQWPFSRYSIWNMPLGSNAIYEPVDMSAPDTYAGDINYFHFNSANPRKVKAINGGSIFVDDGHRVNNSDSRNLVLTIVNHAQDKFQSIQPAKRVSPTGNFNGYLWTGGGNCYPNQNTIEHRGEWQNFFGHGIEGAHWGSGLSGYGGTIRLGELLSPEPIRHALAVEVSGWKYLYADNTDNEMNIESGDFVMKGFRWPADRADGCSGFFGGENGCYNGSNPIFRMGALLAIKPDVNIDELGLTTDAAKKIAWTLQNYGGYLLDDSYGMNNTPHTNIFNFCYELGVNEEFKKQYGYDFDIVWDRGTKRQQPFFKDLDKIIPLLHLISNNGPKSIGGGGDPMQCLAPPFFNDIQDRVQVNPNGEVVVPICSFEPVVEVASVNIDTESLTLIPTGKFTLSASVMPSNATHKRIIWKTSDYSIANVSNNGLITAISSGTATITAESAEGNKIATCTVIVTGGATGNFNINATNNDVIKVYPNPFTGNSIIIETDGVKGLFDLKIFSISGALIYASYQKNERVIELSRTIFNTVGVYAVEVKTTERVITSKLVVN